MIHPGDDARQVAAPGDAGHTDALRVHFRQRPEQRVRQDDVGDGVVGPLVLAGPVDLVKTAPAGRPALFIAKPFAVIAHRHLAAGVHRDGRITAIHPEPHPFVEGRPAAAVNEHHCWHLFTRSHRRGSKPGKNAGRFAAKRKALKADGLYAVGFRALQDRPLGSG